jgi:sensor histidine kinase regulating citrate/malate metabolism
VQLEMIVPRLDFIDDVDLSSILGNMWENAIESCIRARERGADTASICFRSFVSNNHFVMELSNTCIPNKSGEFQSSKTELGHGIGLKVIRSLTDKHHGICGFRIDGYTFISRVVLPVNTDHADGIDDFTVFNWSSAK